MTMLSNQDPFGRVEEFACTIATCGFHILAIEVTVMPHPVMETAAAKACGVMRLPRRA